MDFLKTIGGKVASGLVALAVIAAAISWFRTDPATRHALLSGTGRILGWMAVVAVAPWATFFLIGRVGRIDSNLAGGVLVAAYTAIEAAGLAWLFGWSIGGATAWVFFMAAVAVAGVYDLFTCDWIAEKVP